MRAAPDFSTPAFSTPAFSAPPPVKLYTYHFCVFALFVAVHVSSNTDRYQPFYRIICFASERFTFVQYAAQTTFVFDITHINAKQSTTVLSTRMQFLYCKYWHWHWHRQFLSDPNAWLFSVQPCITGTTDIYLSIFISHKTVNAIGNYCFRLYVSIHTLCILSRKAAQWRPKSAGHIASQH